MWRVELTVEGARVDPPEDTAGWQAEVHEVTEPVCQDKQEELRDAESLGLEVVDLREDTETTSDGVII